ncbi:MAG: 5'/3'-nucleotidase SurE [Bacteroidales bacterium]|nr:5'/3'-nucleotidase SurE [Bacteroidales bacterium]
MRPTILISNDDSIFSKGIKAIVEVAKKFGDVVVSAPDSPQSAKSHSISLDSPISLREFDLFGKDVKAFACSGSPADSIKLAFNHILDKKPDLVISGINHGSNFSINLIYSGTVAAAAEGAIHGVPSIAFSITSHDADADFEATKIYAEKIIETVLNSKEKDICLNVNVPDINYSEIKGIKVCRQTKGAWFEEFTRIDHPNRNIPYFWLTGKYVNFEPEKTDTDVWAIENNYVSVVPIKIDFTDYDMLEKLNKIME